MRAGRAGSVALRPTGEGRDAEALQDGAGSTAPVIEDGLLTAYLAIRVVHVAQGVLCVASGWSSYRRPRLAAATLGACALESGWLIRRAARRRHVDELAARVETATGVGGMVALAVALAPDDRTTSLNWMMPYGVASTVGLALNSRRVESAFDVSALTAAYLGMTLHKGARSGQNTTALTNAASFAGFHAVAAAVIMRGRKEGSALDAERAESAVRSKRLAAEEERNRQHRLLHDSAVQTLEAIANGLVSDPDEIVAMARAEARRLRGALAGTPTSGSVDGVIEALGRQFAAEGLEVDQSCAIDNELGGEQLQALADATREALRNALKHGGVRSVVVRAESHGSGVRVVVRDHGAGFDPDRVGEGFGIGQSIRARMEEVGGNASIWSAPGRGTRVTLWVPAS